MKTINLLCLGALLLFGACNAETKSEGSESNQEQTAEKTPTDAVANTGATADAEPEKEDPNASKFAFDETEYDFGEVTEGDIVEHTYGFTNSGKSPLVIQSAQATCGCTVPDYPKEPIQPGEKGVIKVRFNSSGKAGSQNKAITITANSFPKINKIFLKGSVKSKPKTDGPNK